MKNYHIFRTIVSGLLSFSLALLFWLLFPARTYQQISTDRNDMRQQSQVGFGYTVIKEKCPKANDCLVFAEVDPETFTCAKMKLFGQQLKRKYAQYRHARILFF